MSQPSIDSTFSNVCIDIHILSKKPRLCEEKLEPFQATGCNIVVPYLLLFSVRPKHKFGPIFEASEQAQPLPLNKSSPSRANAKKAKKKRPIKIESSRTVWPSEESMRCGGWRKVIEWWLQR